MAATEAAVEATSNTTATMQDNGFLLVDSENNIQEFMVFMEEQQGRLCNDKPTTCVLDIEGVDLGRDGTIEVVSFGVKDHYDTNHIWLLDAQHMETTGTLEAFKSFVEHPNVVTIIHDCRQDCDALLHKWNIDIAKVHDTAAFHSVLTGSSRNTNLNDTLLANGIAINTARIIVDYRNNHDYWARRPFTQGMLDHASGDITKLFDLYDRQIEKASHKGLFDNAMKKSNTFKLQLSDMHTTWLQCKIPMCRFIGRGGSGINSASERSKCCFYGRGDARKRSSGFLVYYPDNASLQIAKRYLGY